MSILHKPSPKAKVQPNHTFPQATPQGGPAVRRPDAVKCCGLLKGPRGLYLMVAELRAQERQAAEEAGQGKTQGERDRPGEVARIFRSSTLGCRPTRSWTPRGSGTAGDEAIAGADDQVEQMSEPSTAARHGEPAQVFPADGAAADGRPRLDGAIGWSRIRAVPGGAADGRPSLSRFSPLEPGSGPRSAGRGHGRFARRRQRDAGAGTTRARKPIGWRRASTRAWSRWSPSCAPTSGRRPRNWSRGRRATRSAR
jgi:hypothetical protein